MVLYLATQQSWPISAAKTMHDFEINIEISAIATSLHHWQGENQL
jgi:hypothetical protein